MSKSGASSVSDGDFADAQSMVSTTASKAGKRGVIGAGLVESVDAEQYAAARKLVNKAMKDDMQTAMRFAYLVTSGKIINKRKTDEPDGEHAILPGCANKYMLLGKDRIVALLIFLCTHLLKSILDHMHLPDLVELLDYALCLAKKCAVPSKVWGQLKAHAKIRYDAIGGGRLGHLVFVKRGDEKAYYYEVLFPDGGAYSLVLDKKKTKVMAVTHCSGITAKCSPPLVGKFVIENNNSDALAKLTSVDSIMDIPIVRIFKKEGLDHKLPMVLDDSRVGQASPSPEPKINPKPSPTEMPMICDQAAPGSSTDHPADRPQIMPVSPMPAHRRAGAPPAGPPTKKSRGPPSKMK